MYFLLQTMMDAQSDNILQLLSSLCIALISTLKMSESSSKKPSEQIYKYQQGIREWSLIM